MFHLSIKPSQAQTQKLYKIRSKYSVNDNEVTYLKKSCLNWNTPSLLYNAMFTVYHKYNW